MVVKEAIMTTGISLEMIIDKITSGELEPILTKPVTNDEYCVYQATLDTAAALNRIIQGNSYIAVPQEPVDDHIVIDVNGTTYDLMSGKKAKSKPIEPDRLTANTYAIEDKIRVLCRPKALGDSE